MVKCPKCGAILSQEERELYKCTSCGERIPIEKEEQKINNSNVIGGLIKVSAILILVVGTLVYSIKCTTNSKFDFELFMSYEFPLFVRGLLLLGLSEVIKLLTSLKEKK